MKRILAFGLCVVVLLSPVCATSVFAADEVTITGTVYTLLDDNYNVTSAVIISISGEYIIVDNAIGEELYELENKIVRAYGVVGEDSEGNKTLTASKYEVLPE